LDIRSEADSFKINVSGFHDTNRSTLTMVEPDYHIKERDVVSTFPQA